MELIIYFGMMPVIILCGLVAHKLGYVSDREFKDDGVILIIVFTLGLWPLFVIALLMYAIGVCAYIILERMAEGIVRLIKRGKTNDE